MSRQFKLIFSFLLISFFTSAQKPDVKKTSTIPVQKAKDEIIENFKTTLPKVLSSALDSTRHFEDFKMDTVKSMILNGINFASSLSYPGALETVVFKENNTYLFDKSVWYSLLAESEIEAVNGPLTSRYIQMCNELRNIYKGYEISYDDKRGDWYFFIVKINDTVQVSLEFKNFFYKARITLSVDTKYPKTEQSKIDYAKKNRKEKEERDENAKKLAKEQKEAEERQNAENYTKNYSDLFKVLKRDWKGTYSQPFVDISYKQQTLTGKAELSINSIIPNNDKYNFPGDYIFEAVYRVTIKINGTEYSSSSRMRGSVFLNYDYTLLVTTNRYINKSELPKNLHWEANPPTGTFKLTRNSNSYTQFSLTGLLGMRKETTVNLTNNY